MDTISIIGFIVGIVGTTYTVYSYYKFSNGVKNGPLRDIRKLIGRMEEEKGRHSKESTQWNAMHHSQQDLETLFKNLQKMFNISDNDAPL